MAKKTALISGATGVVGRNLLAHLEENPAWNVIGVSRRPPPTPGGYFHIAIDLLNQKDCRSKAYLLSEVTHVFHAAYLERGDSTAWVNDNTAMLINLIQALEPVAK
ncbi:MAG: NAD-dependent epimerase/dehydratase family protein, partial [Betaproteobacteria bacterium]|nr:NAD-dependent epimerase/dehydratase family protein [Betaproteobacteria bacterium]